MWKWLLEKVMHYIIGKDIFGKIQKLVLEVGMNSELTGDQKREKVLEEAKAVGNDFATHMLNLAIEAAVTLMKDKTEQVTKS